MVAEDRLDSMKMKQFDEYEFEHGQSTRFQRFRDLMPHRVREILLVSSLYDSFTFQEDGNLGEMLFSEYQELNLSSAPTIIRVSTAGEAVRELADSKPDLVITMPRVGEMDVFDFGRRCRDHAPEVPVVLLAYDTRELAVLKDAIMRDDLLVNRLRAKV